jgi:TPR repeat protein
MGMSASADFLKGLTAYRSGDYATALRKWKPLAERGNANAQSNIGAMYYDGKGVPRTSFSRVLMLQLTSNTIKVNTNHNSIFLPTINCRMLSNSGDDRYHALMWKNVFTRIIEF